MKYVIYALVPIVVGLISPMIYLLIQNSNIRKESKMNSNDFVICASIPLCFFAIIITFLFSLILLLLNVFNAATLIINIICIPILCFLVFGCYVIVKEKTIVKGSVITHYPIFGRRKTFNIKDIRRIEISIQRGITEYKIYGQTKLFVLSSFAKGTKIFIDKLQNENIDIEII